MQSIDTMEPSVNFTSTQAVSMLNSQDKILFFIICNSFQLLIIAWNNVCLTPLTIYSLNPLWTIVPEKIPQLIQSCRLRYCYLTISKPCISIISKIKRCIRGIFHPPRNAFLYCFLQLFPKPYTTIVIQYITVDLYDFRYNIHPEHRTEWWSAIPAYTASSNS